MPTPSSLKRHLSPWDGVVIAVILAVALGLAAYFWTLGQGGAALTAIVTIDGAEQTRIALSTLTAPEERVLTAGDYTLRLTLTHASVVVTASDCPTQECVHTGVIDRGGESIVCLPARVVVSLQGGKQSDVDLVIG